MENTPMNLMPSPEPRRAHWGWFVACWFVVIMIAATVSFLVMFIGMWESIDAPGDSDTLIVPIVAAVVIVCGILGAFMHRSLRHDASWPKYVIALALIYYPARALYGLLILFSRILFS